MRASFDVDPYPGRPKILFVGLAESTHTHAWIDLLEGSDLNVRLFSLPTGIGIAPEDWKVRTYVTAHTPSRLDPATRARLYSRKRAVRLPQKAFARLPLGHTMRPEGWLARIIRQWQPDVIHTLGLDPAANFYFRARTKYGLVGIGKWVLQLRGGSDLTLTRLDPDLSPTMGEVLRECDQLVSDNGKNIEYVSEMGVREEQISPLVPVPGTGGMDVDSLLRAWHGPPSSRRIILWPKAYESPWSKALPVFEALKSCWDQIQPCEFHMLSLPPGNEALPWYRTLPREIKRYCHIEYRLPRAKVLDLMTQARVMLAPSLIDGTPNSMWEAMAAGALPVVSPLDTIRPVAEDEKNVLFARNLYPHEIADALARAMTDDDLVDAAARRNIEVVRKRADRAKIGPRVVTYYEDLAEGRIC